MNLAVVNEAVTGMNGVEHEFTETLWCSLLSEAAVRKIRFP